MLASESSPFLPPSEAVRSPALKRPRPRPRGAVTLRAYFCQFGVLEDAVVILEVGSACSRGFGFVTFATEEQAAAVLARGSIQVIDRKQVEIKRATARFEVAAAKAAAACAEVLARGEDDFASALLLLSQSPTRQSGNMQPDTHVAQLQTAVLAQQEHWQHCAQERMVVHQMKMEQMMQFMMQMMHQIMYNQHHQQQ